MMPGHNPVLYVEELRRLPLLARRTGAPGAVFVYRSASGQLSAPRGGYTAGELWWRGPYLVYEIDVRPHRLVLQVEVAGGSADARFVEVRGTARVVDPVAVVHHRVTDTAAACADAVSDALHGGGPAPDPERVRLPDRLTLHCGVEMTDLRAVRTSTAAEAARQGRAITDGDQRRDGRSGRRE
jgi:hypothetical protein